MENALAVTEAARNFADVVNRASYRHEATTLLRNGKPVARIVPAAAVMKTGKEIAARMVGKRPRLGNRGRNLLRKMFAKHGLRCERRNPNGIDPRLDYTLATFNFREFGRVPDLKLVPEKVLLGFQRE